MENRRVRLSDVSPVSGKTARIIHTASPLPIGGFFRWQPYARVTTPFCLPSSLTVELKNTTFSFFSFFFSPLHCRALHPRSLLLSSESLSPPMSLVHSRGSPPLLPLEVACSHSFCWPLGLQSCFQ